MDQPPQPTPPRPSPEPLFEVPPGCDPQAIVLRFPVAPEHAGQRLDCFIRGRIPRLSRTRAQQVVRACAHRADGTRRRPGERVRAGETVLLVRERFKEPETPRTFGIVHEDEALLAVDKPAGLPMHPTATYHRNTLTFLLRERFGPSPPRITHRLDRETSGLVLCSKGTAAERALKRAFERREVSKVYVALVRGRIEADELTVNRPLGRKPGGLHVCMHVCRPGSGLEARTRVRVMARGPAHTMVALFPHTGRQHQLRVHLAASGHPIVGDKLYGPEGEEPFRRYIAEGMTDELERQLGHARHLLHAYAVRVRHPHTGATTTLAAPLPDDMLAVAQRLIPTPLDLRLARLPEA